MSPAENTRHDDGPPWNENENDQRSAHPDATDQRDAAPGEHGTGPGEPDARPGGPDARPGTDNQRGTGPGGGGSREGDRGRVSPYGMQGKTAIVTGAGRGIGEAVALALVAEGVRVVAVDLKEPEHPLVEAYAADVTDPARVQAVVDAVDGPIDLLVNVAGVLHLGDVVDLSDEDWAHTFAVNTTGVFHFSRAVARRMIPRRRGAIVTVSSNAGGVPRSGMAAYAASKAATTMFTKCLGLELAPHGIRCNIVAPGSTDTPMQRELWDGDDSSAVLAGNPAAFRVGIPLGRIATPDDVANAVLFLASDRARHITMHDLYVDGGATLRA
ncbi:2,3-dihydro-2,3-dihydroxybenzoate dehydrogenase [Actinoplanes sp. NPDC051851]|uniref:2,3-dihydro-2,3-dihydroxybenzoate dehydrogenase n=1 Tax=Actinoplanes sp. NPDC051851 TaxID=3154753 RepID=UPI00343045F3